MSTLMHPHHIGVVIIGRNEGERLRRCVESVLAQAQPESVVYVDSGSTDGSPEIAREFDIHVMELSSDKPFSAARGRNEGFHLLRRLETTLHLVQFVDGDCELHPDWLACAARALSQSDDVAAVCGFLREREPERSIYNRLCAMEWNGAPGVTDACGGIAMIRVDALSRVGGFREDMIAGEEPELCARLRSEGWKILRINAEMATHDADMTRFAQWWKRALRSGHAWAERAWWNGRTGDWVSVRQVISIVFWTVCLPLLIVALARPTNGFSVLLVAAYPIQYVRMLVSRRRSGTGFREATLYAFFTLIGKFAELVGLMRFAHRSVTSRTFWRRPPNAAPTAARSGSPP